MLIDTILSDDGAARQEALAAAGASPEHERSSLAGKLGAIAKEAAAAIEAGETGPGAADHAKRLGRACFALSILRVEVAKSSLFRIADEGTLAVKAALAQALRETKTPEGRAVLVHLLSDDEARGDAILAIGVAPWPEVLPALIEIAEADPQAARLALEGIARCGATTGPNEANAAADFLLEQLDDDGLLRTTFQLLLRFGAGFPGVAAKGKRLAKEPGKRKVAALCLVAAFGDEGNAGFLELALSGAKVEADAARAFLTPLLDDDDERVRNAAARAWKALDLREIPAPQ
jgi:hypothetical protein